jgi:cytochrome c biogenesis protein CcmG, thiol:disulfide interchange protein DsbE
VENLLQKSQAGAPHQRLGPASVALLVGFILFASVVGIQLMARGVTQPTSGQAPDFALTTFEGDTFRLSDLRGKVVVLNFWASWCGPCRDEAPTLQSLWERYREQGVIVVGVDYADTESGARKFIEEFGITYPNGPDMGTRIADEYNIQGVPETFVINQQGNVVQFIIAPVQPGQVDATIDRLLAENKAKSS